MGEEKAEASRWSWASVATLPLVALLYLILALTVALTKVLEWSTEAALIAFYVTGVRRLGKRPALLKWIAVLSLLVTTTVAVTACQSTIVRSPATVHVRGYTRSDGTSVSSYSRRGPGVAARDRRENAETEWMRWLIGVGWLGGCGLHALFYWYASGSMRGEEWESALERRRRRRRSETPKPSCE